MSGSSSSDGSSEKSSSSGTSSRKSNAVGSTNGGGGDSRGTTAVAALAAAGASEQRLALPQPLASPTLGSKSSSKSSIKSSSKSSIKSSSKSSSKNNSKSSSRKSPGDSGTASSAVAPISAALSNSGAAASSSKSSSEGNSKSCSTSNSKSSGRNSPGDSAAGAASAEVAPICAALASGGALASSQGVNSESHIKPLGKDVSSGSEDEESDDDSSATSSGSGVATDGAEDEDKRDDEDDELDDTEFERLALLNQARGHRCSVSAERWKAPVDWKPPVHEKTPHQHEQIRIAISKSFIFSSLAAESLRQVIDAFEGPWVVNDGTEVICEGQAVSSNEPGLYIVESGQLDVFKATEGMQHPGAQVFTLDKAGQIFGEVALLYDCPRTATVIARSSSVLWSIDRETFNHCVKGAQLTIRARHLQLLASVEILKDLSSVERGKIADVLQPRTYGRGDIIIREGDEGNEFFMVEKGCAFAIANGKRLKEYEPRDYFGELALLNREPRAASVIADASPTVVAVLDAASFERLMGPLLELMAERANEYRPTGGAIAHGLAIGIDIGSGGASIGLGEDQDSQRSNSTLGKGVGNFKSKSHKESGAGMTGIGRGIGEGNAGDDKHDGEEGDDEDLMDDEEFERWRLLARARGTRRRAAVMGEAFIKDPNWKPPVERKTHQQTSLLMEILPKSFMFASLTPECLKQVVKAIKGPLKFKKGHEVIREGRTVSYNEPGLYFLEKGQLTIFRAKEGANHPGVEVRTLTETGQMFGEMALLYDVPRTATVIARCESQVWSLDRKTFNYCVKGAHLAMRESLDQLISSVEILECLTAEERDRIIDALQLRFFEPGQQIIKQGDPGDEFFLLTEGSAFASVDGKKVKEYSSPDYFGELALLLQQPRAADVFADACPVTVAVLDAESFRRLLGKLNELMVSRAKGYDAAVAGTSTAYPKGTGSALPRGANCSSAFSSFAESEQDLAVGQSGGVGLEASEADHFDDGMDDAKLERQASRYQKKGQREGVVGESWTRDPTWRPPFCKKSSAETKQIKNTISQSHLFASLDDEVLDVIATAFFGPWSVQRGYEVIRQGRPVAPSEKGFFIVESGRLDVYKSKDNIPHPGCHVCTFDQRGQTFGEIAMLYDCERTATVIATVDSVLWSLDRQTFNHCVRGAWMELRQRRENLLSSVEVFRSLTPDERGKVSDSTVMRTYSKDEAIILEGDEGNEMFIVESGCAVAMVNGIPVKEYGPSEYFGELALLRSQPRAADVIAVASPTTVAIIGAVAFRELMGDLNEIMVKRAGGYAQALAAAAQRRAETNWPCANQRCGFRNFGRVEVCLKCGTSRPPGKQLSELPDSTPAAMQRRKLAPYEIVPVVAHAVELGGVKGEEEQVVFVQYPRRLSEVGLVQGLNPLVPGESFEVTIISPGTFCEIGVGLAPCAAADDGMATATAMGHKSMSRLTGKGGPSHSSGPAKPRGYYMVGWAKDEVGACGDHGGLHLNGQLSGAQVSRPWEQGDTLRCGIADHGGVYLERNGERVARVEGHCPVERAYPTLTLHSGGAAVSMNLDSVSIKTGINLRSGMDADGAQQKSPAETAAELLAILRRTVLKGAPGQKGSAAGALRFPSLFCSCTSMEVRPVETNGPGAKQT